uniref:Putative ovule protein n=1 Tax=Solanum chacoense TaxID=4108 RepID=A0A0V0IFJ5_SOLCH
MQEKVVVCFSCQIAQKASENQLSTLLPCCAPPPSHNHLPLPFSPSLKHHSHSFDPNTTNCHPSWLLLPQISPSFKK